MDKLTSLGVLISAWTSLTSHFISLFFCYLNFVLNFALCRSFPDSSVVKESTCNTGDPGSIPGSGRSSREGITCPLQYYWTSLVAQLVKESACNAGDLDLIPGLGRSPGEGNKLPTPVFWPGEFHGLYSLWGHKESDMTERLLLSTLIT